MPLKQTQFSSLDTSSGVDLTPLPDVGQKIAIRQIVISVGAAMDVTLRTNGASPVTLLKMGMTPGSPVEMRFPDWLRSTVSDKAIQVLGSIAGAVDITVWSNDLKA